MPVLYVTSIAHHGSCDTYLQSLDLVTTQAHNCLGMAWARYLCISELILDIFSGICRLTPDPGSNERIEVVILKSLEWLSLNMCVLKCILWHTPVSRCCWMDKWCQNSVRKLSFLEFIRVWGYKDCADSRMACVAKIISLLHDRTKSEGPTK